MNAVGRRTIRTLIVDDEPLARRGLELRLAAQPDIEIVGQCGDGEAAMKAVSEHAPDLMFLDVQMPGLDGFGTLRAIPAPQMPIVVFVTAFDHYAIKAFEASAVDYLLKPVDDSRLHRRCSASARNSTRATPAATASSCSSCSATSAASRP